MKIYNSIGCSINGIKEKDLAQFQAKGWMTEEDYKKHLEAKKNEKN